MEIIPLIDVMFFLLASFIMVSLSMQKMQTERMELSRVSSAIPDFRPDIFNIGVNKKGEISVGKTNMPLDKLKVLLTDVLKKNTNTPVMLTADQFTVHGDVNRVLSMVRQAGVQRVSFAVSPKEK